MKKRKRTACHFFRIFEFSSFRDKNFYVYRKLILGFIEGNILIYGFCFIVISINFL